jgi:hypothetical protein
MSDDNTDIVNKIEDIERQLTELRIELGKQKPFKRTGPCEIGEEAVILNPKGGQGKGGKLMKVNPITRHVTIDTINSKGRREKAVRSFGEITRENAEA